MAKAFGFFNDPQKVNPTPDLDPGSIQYEDMPGAIECHQDEAGLVKEIIAELMKSPREFHIRLFSTENTTSLDIKSAGFDEG